MVRPGDHRRSGRIKRQMITPERASERAEATPIHLQVSIVMAEAEILRARKHRTVHCNVRRADRSPSGRSRTGFVPPATPHQGADEAPGAALASSAGLGRG